MPFKAPPPMHLALAHVRFRHDDSNVQDSLSLPPPTQMPGHSVSRPHAFPGRLPAEQVCANTGLPALPDPSQPIWVNDRPVQAELTEVARAAFALSILGLVFASVRQSVVAGSIPFRFLSSQLCRAFNLARSNVADALATARLHATGSAAACAGAARSTTNARPTASAVALCLFSTL